MPTLPKRYAPAFTIALITHRGAMSFYFRDRLIELERVNPTGRPGYSLRLARTAWQYAKGMATAEARHAWEREVMVRGLLSRPAPVVVIARVSFHRGAI